MSFEMVPLHDPESLDLSSRLAVLDERERTRHDRFVRIEDRRRYLAAHLTLRDTLGERLGLAPAAVRIGNAPCPVCGSAEHGRPISLDDPDGTHFSLAHCEGLVVVAIADRAVGVDAEPANRADEMADLRDTLHPDERAAIEQLDPATRDLAVLSCWVRTEACLKAWGTGLGRDPATVRAMPSGAVVVSDLDLGNLEVVDLDVGPDHVAAVALIR